LFFGFAPKIFFNRLISFLLIIPEIVLEDILLIKESFHLALGDLLVTIYTSLPLAIGPAFLSPIQTVNLTLLLKVSESAQLLFEPLSRIYILNTLQSSSGRVSSFVNISAKKILSYFLFSILTFVKSTPPFLVKKTVIVAVLRSLFLRRCFFALLFFSLLLFLFFSKFDFITVSTGLVEPYLKIIKYFTLSHLFILLFVLLVVFLLVVPSVLISSCLDSFFRAFSPTPSLSLFFPSLCGAITLSLGLLVCFFIRETLLLFSFHALSEVVVCIACIARSRGKTLSHVYP
jgi:hypothetical protein